jgi:hypothetical protein
VLRPWPGKESAEVHDYVDQDVPVLASSLAKRAPGYTSLGFADPRSLTPTNAHDTRPRGTERGRPLGVD